jgi:hypothetical protein
MCTVAAASGAASVRVWQITSGGRRLLAGRSPPEGLVLAILPDRASLMLIDPDGNPILIDQHR